MVKTTSKHNLFSLHRMLKADGILNANTGQVLFTLSSLKIKDKMLIFMADECTGNILQACGIKYSPSMTQVNSSILKWLTCIKS